LMGAGIAALVTGYAPVVGWEQALVMLPASYFIYSYCQVYIGKAQEANA
jgi:hypothetical protein